MAGKKSTIIEQQISPTVLSSDLFTPLREPRITLPTIGTQEYDCSTRGPTPWGGCLTTYGGTGCQTFQGTCKLRDLDQGRSHRHFGSGLSNHPTTTQPYRLTDLKLSDCRMNDQRLTTSLKTDPVCTKWQREAWPGHHPYFSHRSIFDVFPSGAFSEEKAPSNILTLKHQVSEATLAALRKVRHDLYQRTLYRDYFRAPNIVIAANSSTEKRTEPTENMVVATEKGLPDLLEYKEEKLDENTELRKEKKEDEKDKKEDDEKRDDDDDGDRETSRCKSGKVKTDGCTVEELLDKLLLGKTKMGQAKLMMGSRPPSASRLPNHNQKSAPEGETPKPLPLPLLPLKSYQRPPGMNLSHLANVVQCNDEILTSLPLKPNPSNGATSQKVSASRPVADEPPSKKFTLTSADRLPGVGPCWPPSTTQVIDKIRGTQLLERHDLSCVPEAYYSTLQPRCCDSNHAAVVNTSLVDDCRIERSGIETLSHRPDGYRTSTCRYNRGFLIPPNSFSSPYHQTEEEPKQVKFIRRHDGSVLYLPPAPLADCLAPSGNNVPHKLGLRFKTEAQWRFHTMHPEVVPDLRSTKNFGKKYFLFGYHSSALRG